MYKTTSGSFKKLTIIRLFVIFTFVPQILAQAVVEDDEEDLRPSLACILFGDPGCHAKCYSLCQWYKCESFDPFCDSIYCDCREVLPKNRKLKILKDKSIPENISFKKLLAIKFLRTPVFSELDKTMNEQPELKQPVMKYLRETDEVGKDLKNQFKNTFPTIKSLLKRLKPRPIMETDEDVSANILARENAAAGYGTRNLDSDSALRNFDVNSLENKLRIINLIQALKSKKDVLKTLERLKNSGEESLYNSIVEHFLHNGLVLSNGTVIIKAERDEKEIERKLKTDDIMRQIRDQINKPKKAKKLEKINPPSQKKEKEKPSESENVKLAKKKVNKNAAPEMNFHEFDEKLLEPIQVKNETKNKKKPPKNKLDDKLIEDVKNESTNKKKVPKKKLVDKLTDEEDVESRTKNKKKAPKDKLDDEFDKLIENVEEKTKNKKKVPKKKLDDEFDKLIENVEKKIENKKKVPKKKLDDKLIDVKNESTNKKKVPKKKLVDKLTDEEDVESRTKNKKKAPKKKLDDDLDKLIENVEEKIENKKKAPKKKLDDNLDKLIENVEEKTKNKKKVPKKKLKDDVIIPYVDEIPPTVEDKLQPLINIIPENTEAISNAESQSAEQTIVKLNESREQFSSLPNLFDGGAPKSNKSGDDFKEDTNESTSLQSDENEPEKHTTDAPIIAQSAKSFIFNLRNRVSPKEPKSNADKKSIHSIGDSVLESSNIFEPKDKNEIPEVPDKSTSIEILEKVGNENDIKQIPSIIHQLVDNENGKEPEEKKQKRKRMQKVKPIIGKLALEAENRNNDLKEISPVSNIKLMDTYDNINEIIPEKESEKLPLSQKLKQNRMRKLKPIRKPRPTTEDETLNNDSGKYTKDIAPVLDLELTDTNDNLTEIIPEHGKLANLNHLENLSISEETPKVLSTEGQEILPESKPNQSDLELSEHTPFNNVQQNEFTKVSTPQEIVSMPELNPEANIRPNTQLLSELEQPNHIEATNIKKSTPIKRKLNKIIPIIENNLDKLEAIVLEIKENINDMKPSSESNDSGEIIISKSAENNPFEIGSVTEPSRDQIILPKSAELGTPSVIEMLYDANNSSVDKSSGMKTDDEDNFNTELSNSKQIIEFDSKSLDSSEMGIDLNLAESEADDLQISKPTIPVENTKIDSAALELTDRPEDDVENLVQDIELDHKTHVSTEIGYDELKSNTSINNNLPTEMKVLLIDDKRDNVGETELVPVEILENSIQDIEPKSKLDASTVIETHDLNPIENIKHDLLTAAPVLPNDEVESKIKIETPESTKRSMPIIRKLKKVLSVPEILKPVIKQNNQSNDMETKIDYSKSAESVQDDLLISKPMIPVENTEIDSEVLELKDHSGDVVENVVQIIELDRKSYASTETGYDELKSNASRPINDNLSTEIKVLLIDDKRDVGETELTEVPVEILDNLVQNIEPKSELNALTNIGTNDLTTIENIKEDLSTSALVLPNNKVENDIIKAPESTKRPIKRKLKKVLSVIENPEPVKPFKLNSQSNNMEIKIDDLKFTETANGDQLPKLSPIDKMGNEIEIVLPEMRRPSPAAENSVPNIGINSELEELVEMKTDNLISAGAKKYKPNMNSPTLIPSFSIDNSEHDTSEQVIESTKRNFILPLPNRSETSNNINPSENNQFKLNSSEELMNLYFGNRDNLDQSTSFSKQDDLFSLPLSKTADEDDHVNSHHDLDWSTDFIKDDFDFINNSHDLDLSTGFEEQNDYSPMNVDDTVLNSHGLDWSVSSSNYKNRLGLPLDTDGSYPNENDDIILVTKNKLELDEIKDKSKNTSEDDKSEKSIIDAGINTEFKKKRLYDAVMTNAAKKKPIGKPDSSKSSIYDVNYNINNFKNNSHFNNNNEKERETLDELKDKSKNTSEDDKSEKSIIDAEINSRPTIKPADFPILQDINNPNFQNHPKYLNQLQNSNQNSNNHRNDVFYHEHTNVDLGPSENHSDNLFMDKSLDNISLSIDDDIISSDEFFNKNSPTPARKPTPTVLPLPHTESIHEITPNTIESDHSVELESNISHETTKHSGEEFDEFAMDKSISNAQTDQNYDDFSDDFLLFESLKSFKDVTPNKSFKALDFEAEDNFSEST